MSSPLRIGTRGSPLALRQTSLVVDRLRRAHPSLDLRVEVIRTTGDRSQGSDTAGFGTRGAFAKEIEEALLRGAIDAAVHSYKDLATAPTPGLAVVATPPREDPRDVLHCAAPGMAWETLPAGARVGTSSVRRIAQLRHHRPDLQFVPIRGNVETRIRKADDGAYDAVALAAAGLIRLGLRELITQYLPIDLCLPEAGQGALALQARAGDVDVARLLEPLDDPAAHLAVDVERQVSALLGGGCTTPVAAHAILEGGVLIVRGVVAAPDGSRLLAAEVAADAAHRGDAATRLVRRLLDLGARELLA